MKNCETIVKKENLPLNQREMDCIEYLFGHRNTTMAIDKLQHGGAYKRLLSSDPTIDGDIAVVGFCADEWHVGKILGGVIVGKENREGDVVAISIEEYRAQNYWVKIYRRDNTVALTPTNNPFNPSN